MKIGEREIGPGHPCYIIAEVGLAHEGSLALALAYVEAAAGAGVDAVKFQCHMGRAEQPWRHGRPWYTDESRTEYWQRTSFTREQWRVLADHADVLDTHFLCSPFSVEAVRLLEGLVPAWKIASGQVTNGPMIRAAAATGLPGIISMGLATQDEADDAAELFSDYVQMISTPLYPTEGGCGDLCRFKRTLPGEPCGLSDHSGSIAPGIAAVALGANLLEVHVTMSRHAYGPDVEASITIEELRQLVDGVRLVEKSLEPRDEETEREVQRMREVYMVHA